jgi:uncharacterized protein YbjT (DUF2867 family)
MGGPLHPESRFRASLRYGGNERSHRHRVRRNRLSRPPHRSASAQSRICRPDRVEAAQRVAGKAHRAGVERLVHVSGIGADAASPSRCIRKRGEGELAVRAAFADTLFVRPAVMFGPDDAFLTTILKLLRQLPIYPMFGRGRTRLQPAYVEDVAEAVARVMGRA